MALTLQVITTGAREVELPPFDCTDFAAGVSAYPSQVQIGQPVTIQVDFTGTPGVTVMSFNGTIYVDGAQQGFVNEGQRAIQISTMGMALGSHSVQLVYKFELPSTPPLRLDCGPFTTSTSFRVVAARAQVASRRKGDLHGG